MARPRRCRKICTEPAYDSFKPEGISVGEEITMTVDEYEVIRLVDLEKYTHEQCAERMGISRTTVTEIYESARYKLFHTQIGVGNRLNGGRRRVKKYLWSFFKNRPGGAGQAVTCSTSGMGLRLK